MAPRHDSLSDGGIQFAGESSIRGRLSSNRKTGRLRPSLSIGVAVDMLPANDGPVAAQSARPVCGRTRDLSTAVRSTTVRRVGSTRRGDVVRDHKWQSPFRAEAEVVSRAAHTRASGSWGSQIGPVESSAFVAAHASWRDRQVPSYARQARSAVGLGVADGSGDGVRPADRDSKTARNCTERRVRTKAGPGRTIARVAERSWGAARSPMLPTRAPSFPRLLDSRAGEVRRARGDAEADAGAGQASERSVLVAVSLGGMPRPSV